MRSGSSYKIARAAAELIASTHHNQPGTASATKRRVQGARSRIEVEDGLTVSAALATAIGVRVVVTKRRRLFLWRDVRIHLDEVRSTIFS
jgi:hypothetical protein